MDAIEKAFDRTFANWDIQLPAEAVVSRQPGRLSKSGWIVEYLFGSEGEAEYLDYYAAHRMTNDRHVRIHSDGRCEGLDTPLEDIVYPAGADEGARKLVEADFYAHNRAVYDMLREKGFLPR